MKKLNQYIGEKLIVNNTIQRYNYCPETKDELIDVIREKIDKEGLGTEDNPLDLNDIDTSKIIDMSNLFSSTPQNINSDSMLSDLSINGYFDISKWDTSNVQDMSRMFRVSKFNGDISEWDVSEVKNMTAMFYYSKFTGENGDISKWNVKNVDNMKNMFFGSAIQNNPPKWYKQ